MYKASFKSPFIPGGRTCMYLTENVSINFRYEYHCISMSCNGLSTIHKTSQRTGNNETKAYPTIHICLLVTLTGDCLSWNAEMNFVRHSYAKCRKVINPKPARAREMTLKIQYGNGVPIVVSGLILLGCGEG